MPLSAQKIQNQAAYPDLRFAIYHPLLLIRAFFIKFNELFIIISRRVAQVIHLCLLLLNLRHNTQY